MRPEIAQLWDWLPTRERREAVLILTLAVVAGISEFATIGAIVPLLAALLAQTAGAPVEGNGPFWAALSRSFDPVYLAIAIACLACVAAALRWTLIWLTERFCARLGSGLITAIYRNVMHESIAEFEARNSSEVLASADKVQSLVYGFVRPLLVAITAGIIALSLAGLAMVLAPVITAFLLATLVIAYVVATRFSLPYIRSFAKDISEGWSKRTAFLRESLNGKREIMLTGQFDYFEQLVSQADTKLRQAEARNQTFAQTPRAFFQPAMIIALVLALLAAVWMRADVLQILPLMIAAAFIMQRMLPTLQSVWSGSVQASGNRKLVSDVLQLASQPHERPTPPRSLSALRLQDRLSIENLSFAYGSQTPVINRADLVVKRGDWVGICGVSGSGKSTLVDLITGLRSPTSGRILVDGEPMSGDRLKAWQADIGLVREGGFLLDATLKENICFGECDGEICKDSLAIATKLAGLDELTVGRQSGLDLQVGEGGLALSNGQRQRVALARALYRRPSFLVLDEATSAMDCEREDRILRGIAKSMPDLTVILVSHRHQSFRHCSALFELSNMSLRRLDKPIIAGL